MAKTIFASILVCADYAERNEVDMALSTSGWQRGKDYVFVQTPYLTAELGENAYAIVFLNHRIADTEYQLSRLGNFDNICDAYRDYFYPTSWRDAYSHHVTGRSGSGIEPLRGLAELTVDDGP